MIISCVTRLALSKELRVMKFVYIPNYVQVMFRPIIIADRSYVECQYTIFITLCEIFSMPSTSQIDAL